MDLHLFLADQVRFELMRRLGWLSGFPGEKYSLLEMVQEFDTVNASCKSSPPELSESHPNYPVYKGLNRMDKEASVRRMLPEAFECFKKRFE